jgi:hypothetical protein
VRPSPAVQEWKKLMADTDININEEQSKTYGLDTSFRESVIGTLYVEYKVLPENQTNKPHMNTAKLKKPG